MLSAFNTYRYAPSLSNSIFRLAGLSTAIAYATSSI